VHDEPAESCEEPALKSRAVRVYLGLVAFSVLGSLFSCLTHLNPQPIARPVAALTLFAGCYAAFQPVVRAQGKRALGALLAVWAIGGCAEILGLASGFPFGRYHYTDRWWPIVAMPLIGNFPLLLPFAWVLVVGSATLISSARISAGASVVSAIASMLIDQAMEPAMTRTLRYWRWTDVGPLMAGTPLRNAEGWFCVSLIASSAMRLILRRNSGATSNPEIVLTSYVFMVLCLGALPTA
jgi:uncharacterized membrane protein